ncbi:conserved protein of unknown function precursor containing a T9SS type A C-terminal secretion signal [Tenacibaculum sp. 190524A02b]|uniref:T9SS type A sorting domain-containing protein n=1 Tax=Tenacibaculum vairaonense TaxID=3137860 RepID=UPI0032B1CE4A
MKKNYLLSLMLVFLGHFAFGQELLTNGDLELWDDDTTPNGWNKAESLVKTNTEKHGGTYSAFRNGGSGTKDLTQNISGIISGSSYKISFWYKASGDGEDVRIWSVWKSGSTTVYHTGTSSDASTDPLRGPNNGYLDNNGGVWTKFETTVVAPDGVDTLIFEVRSYSGSMVYWDDLSVTCTTCNSSEPSLTITSPSEGAELDHTTTATVKLSVANFNVASGGTGDGYIKWKLNDVAQADKFDTNDITFPVTGGTSYKVYIELVDNSGNPLATAVNKTVNFSVKHPCDLTLGSIATNCDAVTSGTDTFNGSIAFTGGNTGVTYTITASEGTIGGDNPNSIAEGTITVTGITEGSDVTVTIKGGANSSCDYTRTLYSPTCIPFPIVETFDYAADSNLTDAAWWQTTSSSSDKVKVTTATLANPFQASEFPNPTGNMVSFDGTGADPYLEYNQQNSGTIYASFLFTASDISGLTNANGGYFVVLTEAGGSYKSRIWLKQDDTDNTKYRIGVSTGSSNTSYTTTMHTPGEEVFVVVAYDFASNELKLWENPAPNTFATNSAPSASLTLTASGNDIPGNLGRFLLRQDSGTETPNINFDELRIATSWKEVTPTGATASIQENTIEGFSIFPNPISGDTFTLTTASTAKKEVTIYTILGREIQKETFTGSNKAINIANLKTGVYLLKVNENANSATKKLVIK